MEKEFVSYEIALELKKLDFDEPCIGKFYYNQLEIGGIWTNNDFKEDPDIFISSPLYQQVFRWFREKYNLRGFIGFRPNTKQFDCHIYDMSLSGLEYAKQRTMEEFNKDPKVGTYEEAELTCLMKLIEIAKNKID
jgi:hypothetical protein